MTERHLFLLEYKIPESDIGFQLCSSRDAARQKGRIFLDGCRNTRGLRRPFGDYSDWDANCIWLASGVTEDAPDYLKGDDELCERVATIYDLVLTGDLNSDHKVYLVKHVPDNPDFEIYASQELARTAVTEYLSDCKLLEGARDFDDHSDYGGPGCVWWAWERVIREDHKDRTGDKGVTVYEIQVDGPLIRLTPADISNTKNRNKPRTKARAESQSR